MAADGRDAAREAVLDDRRHRQHDVDVEPRVDADHDPVLARPQHRRGRAGRAGGDRADAAQPAAGHHPAVVSEDEPGRRADPDSRAHVGRRCRCRSSTSSARRRSRSGSRWSAAWRRCSVYGAQKYAVRVQLDPGAARHAQASASTKSRRRSTRRTSTCRRACCTGPNTALHACRRTASSQNADAVPAD